LYKIVFISIVFGVFTTGCSVLRKEHIPDNVLIDSSNKSDITINGILNNNISKEGYFVKKADIEIVTPGQKENVVATVKYNQKGEYLVSVRSKTGIEAVRVFIGIDTLMINDRINKVLYVGKPAYLERKFSVPVDILPVIFGDLIRERSGVIADSVCINGNLNYTTKRGNVQILSVIDCSRNKVVSSIVKMKNRKEKLSMFYSNFGKAGGVTYPETIIISGLPEQMTLKMNIKSIEIPWIGELEFIPGSKFEKAEIK
jgi:hypothetical protein